jgi:uncharacterized damage-inducible protein DinB
MDAIPFLALYRHMEWADAAVWSAALASNPARTDARLFDLLYHSHVVQHAFLRTWLQQPYDASFPAFEALPPLMAWARSFHDQAAGSVAALVPETLEDPMPVPWAGMVEQAIGRPPALTTRGDTVLQVAMHTHYHRGQVNLRLRELGETPPLVDYIAWVWYGRPRARWPIP